METPWLTIRSNRAFATGNMYLSFNVDLAILNKFWHSGTIKNYRWYIICNWWILTLSKLKGSRLSNILQMSFSFSMEICKSRKLYGWHYVWLLILVLLCFDDFVYIYTTHVLLLQDLKTFKLFLCHGISYEYIHFFIYFYLFLFILFIFVY